MSIIASNLCGREIGGEMVNSAETIYLLEVLF